MAQPSRLTREVVRRYLDDGAWRPFTLSDHWDRNGKDNPNGIAVTDGRQRLTWREAMIWTNRLALALIQFGLDRDDVLVVQLPNFIESPLIRVACEKAGVLCLPVPHTLRHNEMSYCLGFTGATAVIVPRKYRGFDHYAMARELQRGLPTLRHLIVQGNDAPAGALALSELTRPSIATEANSAFLLPRRYQAHEVSLINATTGSTGLPKFAEYTAAARLLYGKAYVETFGIMPNDIIAALSPAAGGPNIPVYFAAPQTGATTVFLSHFEPEAAFKIIEQQRVTMACLVPAQLAIMLGSGVRDHYDLSSVRFWLSVGAPLAPNLARETEETLGGKVLNTYGAVDWGGVVFTSPRDPPAVRYSTVGRPRAGTEVRLVNEKGCILPSGSSEVGELQGRGPSCSTGYYRNAKATEKSWTRDGWLNLGDLGRWDSQGNLTMFGRKDELIIRGGQNIQPREIEDYLLTHPRVKQVAVVGMPDEVMGQRVCAYVVAEDNIDLKLEEIVSFLRSRQVAPFKLPERLEVVAALPMVSDTKINKRILAARIAEKLRKGL